MSNPTISSGRVAGTPVYNTEGEKLGAIRDLVIDKRSGLVRYAMLEYGGLFGVGGERHAIPWKELSYDTGREGYVVPLAKSKLEKALPPQDTAAPPDSHPRGHKLDDFFGEKSI